MKKLFSLIQEFDNAVLSLSEIFDRQKDIADDIYASTAFGDVTLADGQILRNMLDGIVKNKLSSFENALIKPKKKDDESIAEIFVQKITKPVNFTAVSPLDTPFYNMRVTMYEI